VTVFYIMDDHGSTQQHLERVLDVAILHCDAFHHNVSLVRMLCGDFKVLVSEVGVRRDYTHVHVRIRR
jgi:hypothetical protein